MPKHISLPKNGWKRNESNDSQIEQKVIFQNKKLHQSKHVKREIASSRKSEKIHNLAKHTKEAYRKAENIWF